MTQEPMSLGLQDEKPSIIITENGSFHTDDKAGISCRHLHLHYFSQKQLLSVPVSICIYSASIALSSFFMACCQCHRSFRIVCLNSAESIWQ